MGEFEREEGENGHAVNDDANRPKATNATSDENRGNLFTIRP